MKNKSTIRRTILTALLVFATAAIGLQPFVLSAISDSGCTCGVTESPAAATVVAAEPASSCCASPVPEQEQVCCSAKPTALVEPTTANGCCCNPEATECKCVDCKCSVGDEDSFPASPAIPTNETTEIVSTVLICAAPFVGYPRETDKRRFSFPHFAVDFAALSSQQTCVLLSRFTC